MKANKILMGLIGLSMIGMVACKNNEEGGEGGVITIEGAPELAAVEGAWTVAIRFDEVPCNDVYFIGNYANAKGEIQSWDSNWKEVAVKMEKCEGKKTWYQAVIYPIDKDFDGTVIEKSWATGKPVQLQSDGSFDWTGQPALNTLTLVEGINCSMDEENGGEIKFSFFTKEYVDQAKIAWGANEDFDETYFKVADDVVLATAKGWKVSPCVEKLPAGTYTFTAKLPEALPAGAEIFLTGNFPEKAWGESDRAMTKVSDTEYTWTGEVPEGIEWKVFYVLDGEQHWAANSHALITEADLVLEVEWE